VIDKIYKWLNLNTVDKETQIARLEKRVADKEKAVKLKRREAELRARLKELGQEEKEVSHMSLGKIAVFAGAGLVLLLLFAKLVGC